MERRNRLAIYLVGVASIFVILFGIRASANIINPILLAVVLTIAVLPIPSRLTKRGMKGWMAMVVTIGTVAVLLGAVILTVFFSVTRLTTDLPEYMDDTAQQIDEVTTSPDSGTSAESPPDTSQLNDIARFFTSSLVNIVVQMGIALFIFFFMISAAISLPEASRLGLDPTGPTLGRVSTLTEDVRKYVSVLTLINFAIGAGNVVLLLILGVDYALLWGLLAWFMGYIPSIGFMIALIPPVVLAFAEHGLQTALLVLIGYVVINGGTQNFIQPKMMGDRLRMSPVVVFIGLFVWGYLLGGIGAILAVPLTMLVLIILENFEVTRSIAVLMRYTGDANEAEQQEALSDARGFLARARKGILPAKKTTGDTTHS